MKKLRIFAGVPPIVVPRLAGSNTQTSARGTLCVVSFGSPAPETLAIEASVRCCPRCAVAMNARAGEPANTMSRGSSPTSSVRVTCGTPASVTTLTLSDRWLTTHTSPLLRGATATGSSPTGTRACSASPAEVILNTSKVLFGVFTANSLVPSGDIAIGRTCPLSNSMNGTAVETTATAVMHGTVIIVANAISQLLRVSRFK